MDSRSRAEDFLRLKGAPPCSLFYTERGHPVRDFVTPAYLSLERTIGEFALAGEPAQECPARSRRDDASRNSSRPRAIAIAPVRSKSLSNRLTTSRAVPSSVAISS